MERWGAEQYGDPCRGCGFDWGLTPDAAVSLVGSIPGTFIDTLAGASGRERHPDLAWTSAAYVVHVTDNLRIWSERLAGARLAGVTGVPGYDQDLLAQARQYNELALAGALWSLDWAVRGWVESVDAALAAGVVLQHAARGPQRAEDVARNNAHDAHHHLWDVERILGRAEA